MIWLLCGAAWAGWLGDGTSVYVGGPAAWTPDAPAWSAPTEGWSNAGVLVSGGIACTTEEPTTLVCFDAATGAVRWRQTNDYADTLPTEAQAAWRAKLAEIREAKTALDALLPAYSKAQRAARRGDEAAMASLTELSERINSLRDAATVHAERRTPPDKGIIGYGTPTPTVRDGDVFALFGHGVVSRFEADGSRTWSVWLGPPSERMLGYHHGHAASLQWAGDTLVVPLGTLRGLDPADGLVRWEAGEYRHFGTPGVANVGGSAWVILPDGAVLNGATGTQVADAACGIRYIGPLVLGDTVFCIGNRKNAHNPGDDGLFGRAVRLVPEGDGVRVEELWDHQLGSGMLYASPVPWRDQLVVVNAEGQLLLVSARDGAVTSSSDLRDGPLGLGTVYPTPWVVDDVLHVASEQGVVLQWTEGLEATPRKVQLPQLRSTPGVADGALWVRTLEGVLRLGG